MEKGTNQPETKPKLDFKQQFEADQTLISEAAKAFNIDDFAGSTDELRTANIQGVGKVAYKKLSADENVKLAASLKKQDVTDPAEMGLYVIAAMMMKADGKTTPEKFKALPSMVANRISDALGRDAGFL